MKPSLMLRAMTMGAVFGAMALPFLSARAQLKGTAELILTNKSQALVVSASKRWVVLVDLPSAKTWELKNASITIDGDGRVTLVGKEYGGYIVPTKLAAEGKVEYQGEWFRRLPNGRTEQHKLVGLSQM